jgi:threonine/homoserine/homoserine lactone efflux protein
MGAMLDALVPALGFGVVAGLMPGPLQTFLLLKTLERGFRGGLWIVLAPLLSDGPVIAVCLLVLSRAGEGWLRGLSLAGGLFLLYLARESWQTLRRETAADARLQAVASRHRGPALLTRAALINVLGPGPWLFWGTVTGPILIQLWRASPARGVAFLALFYGTLIALLVVQLLLFAYARRLGPRIARAGTWLGIVLLAVFAVLLLLFGIGAIDRYGV